MDGFISVYSTVTGKKQRVPEHYLDHPVLGRNLRRTPKEAAQVAAAIYPEGDPAESWTVPQLTAYAAANAIDLGDATKKADVYAAIQASFVEVQPSGTDATPPTPSPDGTESPDQTPA